jgi:hypothetical protein
MTREEKQQGANALRFLLEGPTIDEQGTCNCDAVTAEATAFLQLLDRELAQPEALEWRVTWEYLCDRILNLWSSQDQVYRSEQSALNMAEWARNHSASHRNVRIESRTPSGPWGQHNDSGH